MLKKAAKKTAKKPRRMKVRGGWHSNGAKTKPRKKVPTRRVPNLRKPRKNADIPGQQPEGDTPPWETSGSDDDDDAE